MGGGGGGGGVSSCVYLCAPSVYLCALSVYPVYTNTDVSKLPAGTPSSETSSDVLRGTSSIMLVEVLESIGSLEISSSLAILGNTGCSLLERPVSVRCNESLLTRFSSVLCMTFSKETAIS